MRDFIFVAVVLITVPAFAQVQSRPTDPPLVTAASESWYQLREPIDFAGELYYPAGAAVFFNANSMARTGHYNGVPLYADTTLEPFSVIYVPVSRGQMQPYERLRRGDLAGTSASRTPSFPVGAVPQGQAVPAAAGAPSAMPRSIGAINTFTPGGSVAIERAPIETAAAITTPLAPVPTTNEVQTITRPESNDGVWIQFAGDKWLSAGPAVLLDESQFARAGEYAGFPVFRRQGVDGTIYLPVMRGIGMVAPYKRKQ